MSMYSQSNDADNVYFNITIRGPLATDQTYDSFPAVFDTTRSQPILAKPSDYFMSIVRLTMPLNSMPIFICPIASGDTTTPWVVGIWYNGTYYKQALLWQTELFAPVSNYPPNWTNFAFSFYTFVSMINVAMATAYAAFSAANPALPQAVANQAPFVVFDPVAELFSWVWHKSWATSPPAVDGIGPRVGTNYSLTAVFDGFRKLQLKGSATHTDPDDNAEYVWEILGNNVYTQVNIATGNPYTDTCYTTQDSRSDNLLSNLRRLVVTSSSMPIINEATPITTGGQTVSNNSSTMPIVTDFVPQIDFTSDLRGNVYYQPLAQYRLTNLISDIPLYRIQLSFFWEDNEGNLYPILISRNQQVEAKIGFFKKSLYAKPVVPK